MSTREIAAPPLALYIHLPWCVSKCPYCDFNSHASPDGPPESDYVAALLRDLAQDLAGPAAGRPLISIFIGGGTPSLFSGQAIARLLDEVRALAEVTPDAEITLEANPGTADAAHFAAYRAAGVNRLSIGVQSLDDEMLFLLGRPHDAATARAAYFAARQAGFANIGLDFLWGLPGQRLSQWLATLTAAVRLAPEHLSCYGLTLEPGTPLAARIESGELPQPPEAEQAEMFVRGSIHASARRG